MKRARSTQCFIFPVKYSNSQHSFSTLMETYFKCTFNSLLTKSLHLFVLSLPQPTVRMWAGCSAGMEMWLSLWSGRWMSWAPNSSAQDLEKRRHQIFRTTHSNTFVMFKKKQKTGSDIWGYTQWITWKQILLETHSESLCCEVVIQGVTRGFCYAFYYPIGSK